MVLLAQPGDPYVTVTGEVIPARGYNEKSFELRVPIAKNLQANVRRSLLDLGTDAQTQTVVNAVLVYHILGMTKNEIAHHLGVTITDIEKIFELEAFQDTFHQLFTELLHTNSNSLQARIAAMAGKSLENLMDLANTKPVKVTRKDDADNEFETDHWSVPPIVVMKSNESILDRSGLTPDILYGNVQSDQEQGLEIEITTASDNKTNVKIKTGR
jgi:predicted transcriptional regulator